MRQPEDRYHDSKTGEFVTDEQGKSDPAGTVLVDHEKPLTPWRKTANEILDLIEKDAKLAEDRGYRDSLDELTIGFMIHVQQLKRPYGQ